MINLPINFDSPLEHPHIFILVKILLNDFLTDLASGLGFGGDGVDYFGSLSFLLKKCGDDLVKFRLFYPGLRWITRVRGLVRITLIIQTLHRLFKNPVFSWYVPLPTTSLLTTISQLFFHSEMPVEVSIENGFGILVVGLGKAKSTLFALERDCFVEVVVETWVGSVDVVW